MSDVTTDVTADKYPGLVGTIVAGSIPAEGGRQLTIRTNTAKFPVTIGEVVCVLPAHSLPLSALLAIDLYMRANWDKLTPEQASASKRLTRLLNEYS